MTHEANIATIEWNLTRAQARAEANPTDWNLTQAANLTQALADYTAHMAGTMERKDMCQTAKDLTTNMPAWATYGT